MRGQLARPVRRAERGNGRAGRSVPRLAPTLLSARRLASAGSKASYNEPGEWVLS